MLRLAVADVLDGRDWGCIFSGLALDGRRVIVRSTEPIWVCVGEVYEVAGDETTWRDRWGRDHPQIDNARLTRVRGSGRLMIPWLKGLPGIGEERARRLLDRFGNDLLDVLEDPMQLQEIARTLDPARPTLGARLAGAVLAAAGKHASETRDGMAEARFYARLEEFGIGDRAAARALWRLLGADAWGRLSQNPYSAAVVLPWKQVDHLGQRLLSAALGTRDVLCHPDRLSGAVNSVVRDLLAEGDTAAAPEAFEQRLARKGVPAKCALKIGLERRRILEFRGLLRAPGAAYLEHEIARHLERLRVAERPYTLEQDLRTQTAVRAAERVSGLRLTDEQRLAVALLLQRSVGLLQGGAGTGKTTSMRVLAQAWVGHVELAALSGKAALKLRRATGRSALTIAQLLKRLKTRRELEAMGRIGPADKGERDGDGRLKLQLPQLSSDTLLILDEASMVDTVSFRKLLEQMPDGSRLLLVGDHAQLPPVGLGQVYHDLVRARFGLAELTQTLRQASDNPLLAAASAIRAGEVPNLPRFVGAAPGVQIEVCSAGALLDRLRAVRTRITAEAPNDEALVLAGRRVTVRDINWAEMARRRDSGAAGVRLGPLYPRVAVGDPVIMTANHYKFGLANGQLGKVLQIEPLVSIQWDGDDEARTVDDEYRLSVEPAWALTVHKAQGSEAPRVIVALDSPWLLTRQWLYTAITRATQQAILVGPPDIVAQAVKRLSARLTGFSLLM